MHQAIFVDDATRAVMPPDPEMIQVGDAIWQRPQWRGLVQGAVRPVGVAEVLVLPNSTIIRWRRFQIRVRSSSSRRHPQDPPIVPERLADSGSERFGERHAPVAGQDDPADRLLMIADAVRYMPLHSRETVGLMGQPRQVGG